MGDSIKEFYYSELPNKSDVIKSIQNTYQKEDPSCCNFQRKITRPKVGTLNMFFLFLYPAIISACLIFMIWIENKFVLFAALFLFASVFLLKQYFLNFIKIYQAFAPESIRLKCRFEPCCSEYMYMSINKYGLLSGLRKGLLRIKKCRPGNGGVDNP
jgi:putative membrane protein insertion efficiency factor